MPSTCTIPTGIKQAALSEADLIISADTWRHEVGREACAAGADLLLVTGPAATSKRVFERLMRAARAGGQHIEGAAVEGLRRGDGSASESQP